MGVGSRESEVGSWELEVGSWESEVGSRKSGNGDQDLGKVNLGKVDVVKDLNWRIEVRNRVS